jgi:hypothetical protein
VEGVNSCLNTVLHDWLRRELTAVLATLPAPSAKPTTIGEEVRTTWERWQEGRTIKPTLVDELQPLRMLLVLDNLGGHKTPEFVCSLFDQGVMPLDTPVG